MNLINVAIQVSFSDPFSGNVIHVGIDFEVDFCGQRVPQLPEVLCLSQYPSGGIDHIISKLPFEVVIVDCFHFKTRNKGSFKSIQSLTIFPYFKRDSNRS